MCHELRGLDMALAFDHHLLAGTRRKRAVTLIEAVLYISVALALIVGGLVFYQQASTAGKTNAFIRQISALIVEASTIYYDPSFTRTVQYGYFGTNATRVGHIIAAGGGAPADTIKAGTYQGAGGMGLLQTSFVNPWGGETEVYVYTFGVPPAAMPMVSVLSVGVPADVCTRVVRSDPITRNGALHSNYAYYSVTEGSDLASATTLPNNVTDAGKRCKNGTFGPLNGPALPGTKPRVLWIGFNIGP